MANQKISELSDGGQFQDTDKLVIARGSENNSIAADKLTNKINGQTLTDKAVIETNDVIVGATSTGSPVKFGTDAFSTLIKAESLNNIDIDTLSSASSLNDNDKFIIKAASGNLSITASHLTGGVQSVVAGSNIEVDNTDPKNPIISATGGGTVHGFSKIKYVSVGTGGDYATIEDAITSGNFFWKLSSDYTISTDIQLPVSGGAATYGLYVPNDKQLTATASILCGFNTFVFEVENLDLKRPTFTATASNKYFIMYNAANEEGSTQVIANNVAFKNNSTHENTGLFGNVDVLSNGVILHIAANADNSGLNISQNSVVNKVIVGSLQSVPNFMLTISGIVEVVQTSTISDMTTDCSMIDVRQSGIINHFRPTGAAQSRVTLNNAGKVNSIANFADYAIQLKITGSYAYTGNGNIASNNAELLPTGQISFSSTDIVHCVFENLRGVDGIPSGTSADHNNFMTFRNVQFTDRRSLSPQSQIFSFCNSNTVFDACRFLGDFKIGSGAAVPVNCKISNCWAAGYSQYNGSEVIKTGNNAVIGNSSTFTYRNKSFTDTGYNALAGEYITWDTTGGNCTFNLPTDVSKGDLIKYFKNDNTTNTVTPIPAAGQTIVGSHVLHLIGDFCLLRWTGAQWNAEPLN